MSPDTALMQEANWTVRAVQADAKGSEGSEARMRLMAYQPKLDHTRYQCPRCWVRNATRNVLSPVSGTDDYDLLRCHACGGDFIIPF